jgi:hypothetical protein
VRITLLTSTSFVPSHRCSCAAGSIVCRTHHAATADRTGATSRPRRPAPAALHRCRSISCVVYTRLDFPDRSCRSPLDRGDTSNPPFLHKYCGSRRRRNSARPRWCSPRVAIVSGYLSKARPIEIRDACS